jgi:hypothetical protein
MTKSKRRFSAHGRNGEYVWRDPRTKIRLAPGAVRNWPTRKDDDDMKADTRSMPFISRVELYGA